MLKTDALSDIKYIKGIGEKRKELLKKLAIETPDDLLWYIPRSYEDRTNIKKLKDIEDGETAVFSATVETEPIIRRTGRNLSVSTVFLYDGTCKAKAVFFNREYSVKALKAGTTYLFFGRAEKNLLGFSFKNPDITAIKDSLIPREILPVYSLTSGITQKTMQKITKNALLKFENEIVDVLPSHIKKEYGLCSSSFAFLNIHFPKDTESIEIARKRLIFEEFFILRCGLSMMRDTRGQKQSMTHGEKVHFSPFLKSLPFPLTSAQEKTLKEVKKDLEGKKPMNRLVQGDVGSGKTAIAAASAFGVIQNGYQAAMMAPTEILARQHFESLSPLFEKLGYHLVLLSASLKAKEKREALLKIKSGEASFIIGTHSLLSEQVEFSNLALAIADEQHRFGVAQRACLLSKGNEPHLLIMSATPIPRTLALIMYGDLDLSIIDALPPGRQKIDTLLVSEKKRELAMNFIKKEIEEGGRAYFVCPAIEEGDMENIKSVADCEQEVRKSVLKKFKIGVVHGKMKASEKNRIMEEFQRGEIKILISTTVIEVGVNVPEANIMVIENAERFGLSSLHQLRGRVGRGNKKSYCILFSDSKDQKTLERLKVIKNSNDGFEIAEEDLLLRGPGDFFGERQHGNLELKIANLTTDIGLLKEAVLAADQFLKENKESYREQYPYLQFALKKMFSKNNDGIFN